MGKAINRRDAELINVVSQGGKLVGRKVCDLITRTRVRLCRVIECPLIQEGRKREKDRGKRAYAFVA